MAFSRDVAVIGGCGRVGLPLGIALADRNLTVSLYDIDASTALPGAVGRSFLG